MLPKYGEEYGIEDPSKSFCPETDEYKYVYFYEVSWSKSYFHTNTELFISEQEATKRCMEIAQKYIAVLKSVYVGIYVYDGSVQQPCYHRVVLVFGRGCRSRRVLIEEQVINDDEPQTFDGVIPQELLKQ